MSIFFHPGLPVTTPLGCPMNWPVTTTFPKNNSYVYSTVLLDQGGTRPLQNRKKKWPKLFSATGFGVSQEWFAGLPTGAPSHETASRLPQPQASPGQAKGETRRRHPEIWAQVGWLKTQEAIEEVPQVRLWDFCIAFVLFKSLDRFETIYIPYSNSWFCFWLET